MKPPSALLVIETTGAALGVGLYRLNGASLKKAAVFHQAALGKQAERLIPTIEKLMRRTKIKLTDLSALVVDPGPGSFTGIRIGVSAARTIAQALALPLVGVSGLEAAAWQAAEKTQADGVYVAIQPALVGDVYHGVYEKQGSTWKQVSPPAWETTSKAVSRLRALGKKLTFVFGTAQRDDFSLFNQGTVMRGMDISVDGLAACAMIHLSRQTPSHFHYEKTVPLYLQPSWAERRN